jgi:hypothetical protein
VEHLAAVTEGGVRGSCFAFYAVLWNQDFEDRTVYRCELRELEHLHADPLRGLTNLWPVDRSWFVYTDYDLCGTKVSGARDLVDRVLEDPEIETVAIA